MWHKSVGALAVEGISSDRIRAIRCALDESYTNILRVISVYLPCADVGIDFYTTHLIELENIICESQLLGRVMVLGDFSAYMEVLGGEIRRGKPNVQGILLSEVMSRCHLSAVSLGSFATSYFCLFYKMYIVYKIFNMTMQWNYITVQSFMFRYVTVSELRSNFAYFSGSSRTTVDYIFSDAETVSLMSGCHTLPIEDFNTSDHVPIVANICLSQLSLPFQELSHVELIG